MPKNVPELQPYKLVFHELWVGKKLVLPWKCIVIPESLQADIIMLANEGHQEISKIKSYLRSKVWFPQLDKPSKTAFIYVYHIKHQRHNQNMNPCKKNPINRGTTVKLSYGFQRFHSATILLSVADLRIFQIPRSRSPFNNHSIRGYPKVGSHFWYIWGSGTNKIR